MNKEEILAALEEGLNNNLMCFDADAADGVVTSRLLALMKTVFRREYEDSLVLFIANDILPAEKVKVQKTEKMKVSTFDLQKHLEWLGGTGYKKKQAVIIGIGKKGQVILGCY